MNDIEVRFPGLLDAELNESERLSPLAASLTLNLYGSSEATITLPEDAPYIRIHDWVSLYTQNGFAGIFRVTNISRNFKRNLEITLLHGIDILSDSVWAEQDKFTGTMEEFLTKALNFQTHLINGVKPWVLGTCEDYSTTFTDKEMNYDRLSTLLEGLIEEGGDYYYEYNMSTFPWTLNVRRKSSVVWSEFRLSRNVTTANVTYNDADLCTRLIVSVNNKTTEERGDYTVPSETVYPDQSAHGLIQDSSKAPGSTAEVTSNETTIKTYDSESGQRNWGIVVKTADIDLAEIRQTWPSVDAWAANFMGLRSQPSVQIQIDGEELAQLSGDNWDELALGRNCRVCLPTYSPGYFNERVVSVTYPDLFSRPSHVTVSLANALPRFSESITRIADKADSAASSARSAGRYAASAEELTKWSQIVEYYGEALDGTGVMTLYRSGIEMDAATGVKIFSLTQGAQSLYAGIQVNSDAITSEVRRAEGEESRIEQKADSIISEVTAARGGETTLSSRITQLATEITSKVSQTDLNTTLTGYVTTTAFGTTIGALKDEDGNITGASVATLINSQDQGVVKISADMIELDGDIIAGYLEGGTLNVNELDADEIVVGSLSFSTLIDGEAAEVVPSFESLTIGNSPATPKVIDYFSTKSAVTAITYADFPHYHTVSFDNATGQITIGGVTAIAPDPFDLTRTTWYQNQISAAEVTGRESITVSSFTWNQPNVSDNPNKPHGKYYSISGQIQLGYQTGVDGQGNPVYTNIGNPIGTGPQEITGVYDAGWTDGNTAGLATGYTSGYEDGQDDVCASPNPFTISASWDDETHQYTLSGGTDIMSSSASSADTLFSVSGSGTLTPTNAINYGRTLVSLNAPTVNQITGQLTASRSFTVAMSGSGTSPEPSKTVYTKLELSGNKVQLKWNSDGSASYPNTAAEYDISSLIADRTATSAGTVTLTATDIVVSGKTKRDASATISQLTTVTYDDNKTTSSIPVTVNAQAIFDQGCYEGWDKAFNKILYPSSAGNDNYINVRIPAQSYNTSNYNLNYYVGTATINGYDYAVIRYGSSTSSDSNIVARKQITSATQRSVSSLSQISVTDADVGRTVTKSTTVTYSDNTTVSKNISVDVTGISSGGSSSRYAVSATPVALLSSQAGIVSDHTTKITYNDGTSTPSVPIQVDATAISGGGGSSTVTIDPSSNQSLSPGDSVPVKALKDGVVAASITVSAKWPTKDEITVSALAGSSSAHSNIDVDRYISKDYKYALLTVTVGSVSKRIEIHIS